MAEEAFGGEDPLLANGCRDGFVNAVHQRLSGTREVQVNDGAEIHRGIKTEWLSHFISMV